MKVSILTASDKGYLGERTDESGTLLKQLITDIGGEILDYTILPDEQSLISEELKRMTDTSHPDIILTTGGTGLSPRDFTPEATLNVIHREVPGIP